MRPLDSVEFSVARALSLSLGATLLSACGATDPLAGASPAPAGTSQSLSMTLSASPDDAQPAFHLAPALLEEPDDADETDPATSARRAPHHVAVNPELAQLSTRHLTRQIMRQMLDTGSVPHGAVAQGTDADPMASSEGVTIYTPAQIRAAYGLPALPGAGASVTSVEAALLGAGQTIYLIDAYDDPNIAAELAAFNSKFGLPACTVTRVSTATTVPLAPAPTDGCVFSVAYATASGAITSTAPAYEPGWATEIAIDVQWAHAIAPYARIVLVESPDPRVTTFFAAAHLINTLGPGVVSMSFGTPEGGWTGTYDANFSAAGMTYFAATGDAGAQVEWPSVSASVVAVAGTSLTYSGAGPRAERVWSGTGGGVSAYVAAPFYQGMAVPGLNRPTRREVADVAFNADPYTGQYIAVIAKGATSASWVSAGGTSLATPQWAAVLAVANALRAQNAVAAIGPAQALLYGLATQPASYASNFLDVTAGSDGFCPTCAAASGYDLPSGLGTPNAASLLPALAGAPLAAAPVVASASVTGKAAVPLSFAISATAAHALTYSLSTAPAGMTLNASTGMVSWNSPVLGTFGVIVQASDAQTGLSGQGKITVSIVAPVAPKVTGGAIAGVAQTALSFTAQVTNASAVTYTLSGAPSGMTVNAAGVISWASPLAGTYSVTLTARDTTTNLSGTGVFTISIAAQKAPIVAPASISGTPDKALSFVAIVPWSNPLTFSLGGAPRGMVIASSTGLITWAAPTVGTYPVTIAAKDTKTGLTGTGRYTVTIAASGPVIQAVAFSGAVGKSFTGSVAITDSASTQLVIGISGMPASMTTAISGNILSFKWSSPVIGNYALRLTVADSQHLSATATIPLVVGAR